MRDLSLSAWFWYRRVEGGHSDDECAAIGRARGYHIEFDHPQDYGDGPLPKGHKIEPGHFPRLNRIMLIAHAGDQIGLLAFGQLGSVRVWTWLAKECRAKAVIVQDCASGKVFDFVADDNAIAFGADLLAQQLGQTKIASANLGRATSPNKGGPKLKLVGARYQAARAAWSADDDRTADEIASEFNVHVTTMYRRMTDTGRVDGRPVGREAAKLRHKQGLWVLAAPKRAKV